MHNLTISDGWFDGFKEKDEKPVLKKLCEHKANSVTLDYDVGVEYCNFCGSLGHYSIEKDIVEWKLPEFLVKQNYN